MTAAMVPTELSLFSKHASLILLKVITDTNTELPSAVLAAAPDPGPGGGESCSAPQ